FEDSGAHFVALPDDGVRDGDVERDYLHCDILAVLVVFKWCPEGKTRILFVPQHSRRACAIEIQGTSLPAVQYCCAVDAIRLQVIQSAIGITQRKKSDLAADRNFGCDSEEILAIVARVVC